MVWPDYVDRAQGNFHNGSISSPNIKHRVRSSCKRIDILCFLSSQIKRDSERGSLIQFSLYYLLSIFLTGRGVIENMDGLFLLPVGLTLSSALNNAQTLTRCTIGRTYHKLRRFYDSESLFSYASG